MAGKKVVVYVGIEPSVLVVKKNDFTTDAAGSHCKNEIISNLSQKNSDETIPTLKFSSSQVPCKLSFKTLLQVKLEGLAHNCCGQNI